MRNAVRSGCLAFAAIAAFLPAFMVPATAKADAGMWPFNLIPKDQMQKDHGVQITDPWLDHVRLSSVRFNNGGSGSFVSTTGLVLTNHHVGADCIAKLASPGHDFLATGYLAGKDGPEAACPDLELNVLQGMEDVTDKVHSARQAGMDDAAANVAQKAAMSAIEKDCTDASKGALRCDVVTLYAGGKYHLYKYKKYTDIRLVFAPEQSIAFFGGDPDNFTYPRFDLDMAVFRVYENGAALKPTDSLTWSETGPKDGEAVFTSGHPGSTSRQNATADLAVTRDLVYPYVLGHLKTQRDALVAWAKDNGSEGAREIKSERFHIENSLKALGGMEKGLRDPKLFAQKKADEDALIKASPDLAKTLADVAKVQDVKKGLYKKYALLEGGANASEILSRARDLVRMPSELAQPDAKRLREYRGSGLDSLKLRLFSPAPISAGVEVQMIKVWLDDMKANLGAKDPSLLALLNGDSSLVAAEKIVAGSKLTDVNARRSLFAGGQASIDASKDPAIVAMRNLDAAARAVRKQYEDAVEAPMRHDSEQLAQAIFAAKGTSVMPDATFTLRLSIGTVKGYTDGGKTIPPFETFAGMYKHATGAEPYKLPQRWLDAKSALKLDTNFNMVTTNDIIGGNSGSPIVNAGGQLVGLVFDGNIQSLPSRFVYSETEARCVAVDTSGILEALRHVYKADALVAEFLGKPAS